MPSSRVTAGLTILFQAIQRTEIKRGDLDRTGLNRDDSRVVQTNVPKESCSKCWERIQGDVRRGWRRGCHLRRFIHPLADGDRDNQVAPGVEPKSTSL